MRWVPGRKISTDVRTFRVECASFCDHPGGTIDPDGRPTALRLAQPTNDPAIATAGIDGCKGALSAERRHCGGEHLIDRSRMVLRHGEIPIGRRPLRKHLARRACFWLGKNAHPGCAAIA